MFAPAINRKREKSVILALFESGYETWNSDNFSAWQTPMLRGLSFAMMRITYLPSA